MVTLVLLLALAAKLKFDDARASPAAEEKQDQAG
jgi:hypothetical protein